MPSRVADILMQQGAISANLWQQLGQLPGQVYAGVQAQKLRQLQEQRAKLDIEGGTLDVETRRRQADATRAFSSIIRDTPRTSQEGLSLWDVPTITQRMGEQGYGPEASTAAQHLEGLNESLLKHHEARVAFVQRGAQAIQAAGNDPTLAGHLLDQIEENEVYPKETVQKYRDFIHADPANVAKLTALLAGPEEVINVPAGGTAFGKRTGTVVARGAPQRPTEASLAAEAAGGDPGQAVELLQRPTREASQERAARAAETERHNREMERIATLTVGRADAAQKETGRHNRAMEALGGERIEQGVVRVEHLDPTTGKTVIEYLPKSEVRGKTFQKGVGATLEARLASAQAVNQTGEDMIRKLSDPAYAAKLGPVMGRFNTLHDFIGNPPPEFAELAGTIESYSLANMGVHGMRSAQGAQQIVELLNKRHTPESLIAAIRGLNAFSTHFMQNEGRVVAPGGAAPNGSIDALYDKYLKGLQPR